MYRRPDMITPGVNALGNPIDPREIQQYFEVGDVYVRFREQERASNALKDLTTSVKPPVGNMRRTYVIVVGTARKRIGNHEECSHGGRGSSRRYDDREEYHESRSRRHRSISPGHWRGQRKRKRSPVRERSEERHAKIAQWNQLGTLTKAHQASATSNFTVLNWVLLHKLSVRGSVRLKFKIIQKQIDCS
ncbi:hypothetical protein Peur_035677 [Populus x canadensis]